MGHTNKTAGTDSSRDDQLIISAKAKKNYKSLVEILKRRLTVSRKSKMPMDLKPMLATIIDAPFSDTDWQFELKLDGYRALAYTKSGKVELRSRNNNSFNSKFKHIYEAMTDWPIDAVVDGEIVVLNEAGKPDFNGIQQWEKKKAGRLVFYVFDLLWLDGMNIMDEPLYLRRELLKQLVPDSGPIRFSDHIEEAGEAFFEVAKNNSIEGIIAKQRNAPYLPDSRSWNWLKIKIEQRHEAVICGYTRKKSSDREFSSLLLGTIKDGELNYLGQAGTGYTSALQKKLMKKFRPATDNACPFDKKPSLTEKPLWLKPELVCEVKYTELTPEGVMRHGSFQGLREDKSVRDFNDESKPIRRNTDKKKSPSLFTGIDKEKEVKIEGQTLKLTNLKKLYWPKEKITKGSLLEYYHKVAEYMLPYMIDRPQSLNRFPNGVTGENFYHKNMTGKLQKGLKTFRRYSESTEEDKDFLVCNGEASLLYMANLGCIEMNPWHSRTSSPEKPDWCVVDLDPGRISFERVIETANVIKGILDQLKIHSVPKTSGSTGIHIYIPLGAKYSYEQSKQLAELIANLAHDELPEFTSLIRNPRKREDKIYIDYLQNRPIQTICAPYSVRPKPGATVSTPLHWDEVKPGLKISSFTMKNIFERLHREGDLFKDVLGHGIDLKATMKNLAEI